MYPSHQFVYNPIKCIRQTVEIREDAVLVLNRFQWILSLGPITSFSMAGFMGAERHIKSMPIDVNPLKRLLLPRKVGELLYVM